MSGAAALLGPMLGACGAGGLEVEGLNCCGGRVMWGCSVCLTRRAFHGFAPPPPAALLPFVGFLRLCLQCFRDGVFRGNGGDRGE